MFRDKKSLLMIVSTIAMLLCIVAIGPIDVFTHGYFSDEVDCGQIAADDYLDTVNLETGNYTMTFSPRKEHMAGIEIYLVNQPEGNNGILNLSISDASNRVIDSVDIDLGKVKAASWYKVYTSANLKKNREYSLTFSVRENCISIPHLQNVHADYLPDETVTGNVLLSYAYKEPTFTFQNKVIIVLFILSVWLFTVSFAVNGKRKKVFQVMACFLCITAGLTWNYMYNSMDNQNTNFSGFQVDSETLVTGVIYAEEDGEYFRSDEEKGFGLGRYYDLKGSLQSYALSYITDDNWLGGYSRNEGAIIVNSNEYSREVAVAGNQVKFENGEVYQIVSVEDDGSNIVISLDSGKVLTPLKNGFLDNAVFLDGNGSQLHASLVTAYKSQYGLQGKVFRHWARYMDNGQEIANLNLICSIATAVVFALIIILLAAKYNNLFAGCFLITFWLLLFTGWGKYKKSLFKLLKFKKKLSTLQCLFLGQMWTQVQPFIVYPNFKGKLWL